jgi:hypothetical protein
MLKRGGVYDRHHFIEEPCEVKVSSTVLKTGGVGDDLAEFNHTPDGLRAHGRRTPNAHIFAFKDLPLEICNFEQRHW